SQSGHSNRKGYCGSRKNGPSGSLPNAIINVTNRCNLRCEHCAVYMESDGRVSSHTAVASRAVALDRVNAPLSDSHDYPFHEITQLIDKLAARGVRNLVLFGGEPLLRRDLADIICYAASRVPNLGLATNGTLFKPEITSTVAAHVKDVRISLDGSCPEVHDRIRGPKAFVRTMEGIRMLRRTGFRNIYIKAVITRKNVGDIPNLVKLASHLEVKLELNVFLPLGRGCVTKEELHVDTEQLIRAFKCVWLLAEFYGLDSASFNAACNKWIGRASDNCGAGDGCVLVDCSGDVYPCEALQYAPLRMGNLVTDKFVQIAPLTDTFDRRVDSVPNCSTCEVRYFCSGGCAAEAYLSGGETSVSALCDFYRTILPLIASRWDPGLSSWRNLKRVFPGELDFSLVRDYLPASTGVHA
ncbi:MAG TPA: radical SAM protein, partial [Blastocatellia bacterium]|nr:radical SAM protein [Blastocatellia bacterium]